MALDLARQYEVTAADRSEHALLRLRQKGRVNTIQADLSDPEAIKKLVRDFDLVIGALPGFMGFASLKAVLEAGRSIVDISFFPEDPFELDALAKAQGVTAVVDCGVAPGMGNILLGYHHAQEKVSRFRCLVGGLPQVRQWPWEYRAVFSPADVIEEYVRSARYRQHGQLVVRPALSDTELIDFPEVGTLEAFNTDGLRTLLHTLPDIPDMIEKTMRYPGTAEYLRVLRDSGFFSEEKIALNGIDIRPVDFTARLLFPQWKLPPGEGDITVMRIEIETETKTWQYDLLDRYDPATDTISMARTTGFTCTAVANLLLSGQFTRPGICPPEFIGPQENCLRFVMDYLSERGVHYSISKKPEDPEREQRVVLK